MTRLVVVRAWRDPVFRSDLTTEALRELPKHPAGDFTESDELWRVPGITFTGGCGTPGCSRIICTDPCSRTCWARCPNTSDERGCTP